MFEIVLVGQECIDGVNEEEVLSQAVNDGHGKVEVCIGTASVNPKVPQDRPSNASHKEHNDHRKNKPQV